MSLPDLPSFIVWFGIAVVAVLVCAWVSGLLDRIVVDIFNHMGNSTTARTTAPLPVASDAQRRPYVQVVASIAGMAGAWLLASKVHPALGFGAFLLSNIGWLDYSGRRREWWLFAQQVVFLVSSLVGLWNWWLGPLVLGGGS